MSNAPFPQLSDICQQVEAQVMAYLKDGLSPAGQQAIRQHLLACPRCAQIVQEAREWDRSLQLTARYDRPHLSPEASTHIQSQMYRRMRRALIFQHTRRFTERLSAIGLGMILVVILLLAGRPWLNYLAAPMAAAPSLNKAETTSALPLPTRPLSSPAPLLANQSPIEAMDHIIQAALNSDTAYLELALNQTRPRPDAAQQVWNKLARCHNLLTPANFQYRIMAHGQSFVSIYIFYDKSYVGDLKMMSQQDGNWQMVYLNYVSFTALRPICPFPD